MTSLKTCESGRFRPELEQLDPEAEPEKFPLVPSMVVSLRPDVRQKNVGDTDSGEIPI